MYHDLLAVWKEERSTSELVSLPPDFYMKVSAYISHLETMSKTEEDPLLSRLFEARRKRVIFLLKDSIQLRYQKITTSLLSERKIPMDKLTVEENRLVKSLLSLYQDFISAVFGVRHPTMMEEETSESLEHVVSSSDEVIEQPTKEDSVLAKEELSLAPKDEEIMDVLSEEGVESVEYEPVLVTSHFEKQFVGVDLQIYGPFQKDSIAYLPKENAAFLIRTGGAERIEASGKH